MSTKKSALREFAEQWFNWTFDKESMLFGAWSIHDKKWHGFTRQELITIDACIPEVLAHEGTGYDRYGQRHKRLLNTAYMQEHPERLVEGVVEGVDAGEYYWIDFISAETDASGKLGLLLECFESETAKDGKTHVAQSVTMNVRFFKENEEWESIFPGITKFYAVAMAVGMNDTEASSYCKQMLFDTSLPQSITPACLPEIDLLAE